MEYSGAYILERMRNEHLKHYFYGDIKEIFKSYIVKWKLIYTELKFDWSWLINTFIKNKLLLTLFKHLNILIYSFQI